MTEQNIPQREIVKLEGSTFPSHFAELLTDLERLGFANCILRGGALRDTFLGIPEKINDWDLWGDFGAMRQEGEDFDAFKMRLTSMLSNAPWMENLNIDANLIPDQRGVMFEACKISFTFRGHKIEFNVNKEPITDMYGKIREADAPINSIGMNANCEVFCDADFQEHARERWYMPFSWIPLERAQERFNKLSEKISGLIWRTFPGDNKPTILPKTEPK